MNNPENSYGIWEDPPADQSSANIITTSLTTNAAPTKFAQDFLKLDEAAIRGHYKNKYQQDSRSKIFYQLSDRHKEQDRLNENRFSMGNTWMTGTRACLLGAPSPAPTGPALINRKSGDPPTGIVTQPSPGKIRRIEAQKKFSKLRAPKPKPSKPQIDAAWHQAKAG
jgi:hypothetical protein